MGLSAQRIIHLDVDPSAAAGVLPAALVLAGDARETLGALVDEVGDAPVTADASWRASLVADHRAHHRLLLNGADEPADAMHPAVLARELGDWLPEDALVVYDGGHTTFWSNDLTPALEPRTRFHDPGMAHLGFGLPYALALQAAFPGRTVVNVTGDGAFGFTLAELDTARRNGLPVVTVIHDNAAWGVIRFGQQRSGFDLDTALTGTDYAAVARAFGCHGEWVTEAEQIRPALDRAVAPVFPRWSTCACGSSHIPLWRASPRWAGPHDIEPGEQGIVSDMLDVAIVGYGPVGQTLAALLGQAGVRVGVFERHDEPYGLPRAIRFDHEAMRIWQRVGIVDALEADILPIDRYEWLGADGEPIVTFRSPPTPSGWAYSYVFYQPLLEAALDRAVRSQPTVELHRGLTAERLEQSADHVELGLRRSRDPSAGESTARTRWVVGADGASSFVREALGITLEDLGFRERWLVLDLRPHDAGLLEPPPLRASTATRGGRMSSCRTAVAIVGGSSCCSPASGPRTSSHRTSPGRSSSHG